MTRVLNVLFLCTENSARSIMAEATMNRLGQGRFRAFSAGSQPKAALHPATVRLFERQGIDAGNFRPKSWDDFSGSDSPCFDFIFTLCDNAAREACPEWPGHPVSAQWGIPDPAASQGSDSEVDAVFARAQLMLSNRISLFMALPFEELDQIAIHDEVRRIGDKQDEPL